MLDFITSCKLCQEFIASSKMAVENKSYPFQYVINTYFHTSVISAWKAQQIWGLKILGKTILRCIDSTVIKQQLAESL